MAEQEIHLLAKRIQKDIETRYGEKISLTELSRLFCFSSRESMIRLIQLGQFPVEVAREKGWSAGEVTVGAVKNVLIDQYLGSVRKAEKHTEEEKNDELKTS